MAGPQDCAWSEGYAYDGFGNLTDKNVTGGTAPSLHVTVDSSTNHLTGYTYDLNGNLTNIPSQVGLAYDVENRTKTATPAGGGAEQYANGPDNQRIWKLKADGTEELYYYDLQGHRLGHIRFIRTRSTPRTEIICFTLGKAIRTCGLRAA